ncbi:MAG: O-acetyl-ADP-ribose deacetylase [Candidatus Marinimicrobia bacterium]|nr:O-acetyl-ADP-ribose deacetylase [Candidatus Neomarinimicrobiota bacterium]
MKKTINHVTIDICQGNIVAQKDIDAVVNAANAQLMPGGGVAGAIHRAAGPKLAEACKPLAPILPGEAVITPAFNLPNKFVIHCLGPVYGVDKPEDELLSRCYLNALKRGEEKHIRSIAFPAISTGAFGYPVDDAADVALHCVQQSLPGLHSIRLIRFVLFSPDDLKIYIKKAGDIL